MKIEGVSPMILVQGGSDIRIVDTKIKGPTLFPIKAIEKTVFRQYSEYKDELK